MKMHPSCLMRVEELIKDEDDNVKNIIRNLCDSTSTKPRIAELAKAHPSFYDEDDIKDGRVKNLVFSNFRTYPGVKQYGLSFVNGENKVSSVFLVGGNGSGKSTLYTALEKLYKGESSYASLMSNDEEEYLTFGFDKYTLNEAKRWEVECQLAEIRTSIVNSFRGNLVSPISVPAFFCSDIDVQCMKQNKSLFLWILEQMGYGKLEKCLNAVSDLLKDYRTLQEDMTAKTYYTPEDYAEIMDAVIEYESELHDGEIKAYSSQMEDMSIKHHLFAKKWNELNLSTVVNSENQLENLKVPNEQAKDSSLSLQLRKDTLMKLYKKLAEQLDNIKGEGSKRETILALGREQQDTIKNEILTDTALSVSELEDKIRCFEKIESLLQNLQIQIVSEFIDEYGKDIEQTITDFSNHGEKFEFTNDNIKNVNLSIHCELKGTYNTFPHQYFNEFRFKLYCITLKLAIAFNWMLKNQKSLPIVIDDVFNANDFENSIKLEQFAYFIKKMYNDKVLAKGFPSDLQMILTTHDELVVDSFRRGYNGLECSDAASMKMDRFPLIVGRIYRLEEIDSFYPSKKTEFKSIYQYV